MHNNLRLMEPSSCGGLVTLTFLIMVLLLVQVYGVSLPDGGRANDEDDDDDVDDQLEHIKKGILQSLGMSRVPDVSRVNSSRVLLAGMLKVFKRSVQYEREQHEYELQQDARNIRSAVKYFYSFVANQSYRSDSEELVLRFDLKNYTSARRKRSLVTNANLKMYKVVRAFRDSSCRRKEVFVNVYQILTSRSSAGNYSDETMLVSSRRIADPTVDGWESFSVLETVRMWWRDDKVNDGIVITCQNCRACGVSLTSGGRGDDRELEPRIDLYAKEVPVNRVKRSWRRKNLRRFGKKKNRSSADCVSGRKSSKCCRDHLWVSFKEIGWDSWIISPEGFDAYYCKGKCSGRFKPANTHTLVQTAMRKKINASLPKPCCVPKKLTPLSLYHYDDSDPPELVLTKHKGMIVKSCACS